MEFRLDPDGVVRLARWDSIPWLVHGFTTRSAGDFRSLNGDEARPLSWVPSEMKLRRLRQVHSNRVATLRDTSRDEDARADAGPRPEADALATRSNGILLGVRTADCVPILLLDARRRVVAAVHAGWRGTARRIAERAVSTLRESFGSRPKDIEAAIGPGIGPCCFEVGAEVAEQFDRGDVIAGRRPRVDLPGANRRQLEAAGVPAEMIRMSGMCTMCAAEGFHSYRRDGEQAGRMLAVIGLRPEVENAIENSEDGPTPPEKGEG